MRSNHPSQELQDGFEAAPLQIGPDGGIRMAPQARAIPPPPRLCEAGPCRHYHRMATQLDAERPIDGSPGPFHVHVHHYCYPTVGIETTLEGAPVLECNRWEPLYESDLRELDQRRQVFMESERGQKYARELAQWHEARAEEQAAFDEASKLPDLTHVIVAIRGTSKFHRVEVTGTSTLRDIRKLVLARGSSSELDDVESWAFSDMVGNEITNLESTLHELGILDGERFILQRPPQGA